MERLQFFRAQQDITVGVDLHGPGIISSPGLVSVRGFRLQRRTDAVGAPTPRCEWGAIGAAVMFALAWIFPQD